ncbi:MAG: hypothetical protein IT381_25940 [Deltaproteobacteria bacterium]|nr:hypothetical protein [Deltaproteobacteria bacterium]
MTVRNGMWLDGMTVGADHITRALMDDYRRREMHLLTTPADGRQAFENDALVAERSGGALRTPVSAAAPPELVKYNDTATEDWQRLNNDRMIAFARRMLDHGRPVLLAVSAFGVRSDSATTYADIARRVATDFLADVSGASSMSSVSATTRSAEILLLPR